jgi:hypothetical protein
VRNSFLNQIARKAVETYIARNEAPAPVASQPILLPPLLEPITPPIIHIEPPIVPIEPSIIHIEPPIVPSSPVAQEENLFVSLPATPPNERISEIDSKQAEELASINERSAELGSNRIEAVEAIYARYLSAFPLLPELPSREPSPQHQAETNVLENVPLTPPPPPSAPSSPDQSNTFVVVDVSR